MKHRILPLLFALVMALSPLSALAGASPAARKPFLSSPMSTNAAFIPGTTCSTRPR